MGQQQLLLVILVTIIVGIATVVAINVFGTAADNANVDAVRQDLLSAATAAQGWYLKPTMLGGGGNSYADLTLETMNIPGTYNTDGTLVTNENGAYRITTAGTGSGAGATFAIGGLPVSAPAATGEIILTVTMTNVNGKLQPVFGWSDI